MNSWRLTIAAGLAAIMLTTTAQAGIVVGGTRLVYDGSKREASLTIRNPDPKPYLIQSWVDAGENVSEKAPFVVTPPLYRHDAEQSNILRVVRAGGNLPEDRESVFWMNVKSIPSADKSATNTLQLAIKTRIKLFYRPAQISKIRPGDVAEQLTWRRTGSTLEVNNPTPFHFTFLGIAVGEAKIETTDMIAPFSSRTFDLPAGAKGSTVNWEYINDYGGRTAQTSGL